MKDRLELAGIGAIAGLCLWSLFELLPDFVEEGFCSWRLRWVRAYFSLF